MNLERLLDYSSERLLPGREMIEGHSRGKELKVGPGSTMIDFTYTLNTVLLSLPKTWGSHLQNGDETPCRFVVGIQDDVCKWHSTLHVQVTMIQ